MIRIESQADKEFRDRFYRCGLVENPDPRQIKLWLMLIANDERVKEADLIDRVLNLLKKESSPENNTRALNMIFDARNQGYIRDITIPYSHNYMLNKVLIKEDNMFDLKEIIGRQSKVSVKNNKDDSKDSVKITPLDQPNVKYKIRHEVGDFYCSDKQEKTTELQGRLEGIYHNERPAAGANFNITEFLIVLVDESESRKIIAYG